MYSWTDRQTTSFFYKVETYIDHLLVNEIHAIPYFVKVVRVVLDIYVSCVHRQTDNPIFYEIETYLECLLVPEIYIIPNFVKIVRAVLEKVNIYMHIILACLIISGDYN